MYGQMNNNGRGRGLGRSQRAGAAQAQSGFGRGRGCGGGRRYQRLVEMEAGRLGGGGLHLRRRDGSCLSDPRIGGRALNTGGKTETGKE